MPQLPSQSKGDAETLADMVARMQGLAKELHENKFDQQSRDRKLLLALAQFTETMLDTVACPGDVIDSAKAEASERLKQLQTRLGRRRAYRRPKDLPSVAEQEQCDCLTAVLGHVCGECASSIIRNSGKISDDCTVHKKNYFLWHLRRAPCSSGGADPEPHHQLRRTSSMPSIDDQRQLAKWLVADQDLIPDPNDTECHSETTTPVLRRKRARGISVGAAAAPAPPLWRASSAQSLKEWEIPHKQLLYEAKIGSGSYGMSSRCSCVPLTDIQALCSKAGGMGSWPSSG